MSTGRLSQVPAPTPALSVPAYTPSQHGVGIVHLGLGAFHKAHQAVYTDDALAAEGGNWRIAGVSLRSLDISETLAAQNGLYTVIERGAEGLRGRVIGSIARALALRSDPQAVASALAAPSTRIISLTVTEKAYGILPATRALDRSHAALAHDLEHPDSPQGVLGLLAKAMAQRASQGSGPVTVLCCDNLPENGAVLEAGLNAFVAETNPTLAGWIRDNVRFPSTMVDRITPASTAATFADAEKLTGFADAAAVETEPFRQWVIEDHFSSGRPRWEAGGAIVVSDVVPYETMKLTMLNGSHSLIAYAGFLTGHAYVRDVMRSPYLAKLVHRHLKAAAQTVGNLEGINLETYAQDLVTRFSNPSIAHETYQIAMDGSLKMPLRIFNPAVRALAKGADIRSFALACAVWMRYALGRHDDGTAYELRDPLAAAIKARLSGCTTATDIFDALAGESDLLPASLRTGLFREATIDRLSAMLERGVRAALEEEAAR